MYAIAGRATRVRNLMEKQMADAFSKTNDADFFGFARKLLQTSRDRPYAPDFADRTYKTTREVAGAVSDLANYDIIGAISSELQRRPSFKSYVGNILKTGWWSSAESDSNSGTFEDKPIKTTTYGDDKPQSDPSAGKTTVDTVAKDVSGVEAALVAEFNDGTAFASFRVDYACLPAPSGRAPASNMQRGI